MKKFDIFWLIFIFIGRLGIIGVLLIPLEIELYQQLVVTVILAGLFAKLEFDKQDLDNKIFELKQLMEKQIKG